MSSVTIKANIELSGKEIVKILQKPAHNHYCLNRNFRIDDWDFNYFEKCKTHKEIIN